MDQNLPTVLWPFLKEAKTWVKNSKVPEGHHPRGTTLREALRGNLPLRGLCGALSEGSAGSLRSFCGASAGLCGGPRDFPRFSGVVTLCLWQNKNFGQKNRSAYGNGDMDMDGAPATNPVSVGGLGEAGPRRGTQEFKAGVLKGGRLKCHSAFLFNKWNLVSVYLHLLLSLFFLWGGGGSLSLYIYIYML